MKRSAAMSKLGGVPYGFRTDGRRVAWRTHRLQTIKSGRMRGPAMQISPLAIMQAIPILKRLFGGFAPPPIVGRQRGRS